MRLKISAGITKPDTITYADLVARIHDVLAEVFGENAVKVHHLHVSHEAIPWEWLRGRNDGVQ